MWVNNQTFFKFIEFLFIHYMPAMTIAYYNILLCPYEYSQLRILTINIDGLM